MLNCIKCFRVGKNRKKIGDPGSAAFFQKCKVDYKYCDGMIVPIINYWDDNFYNDRGLTITYVCNKCGSPRDLDAEPRLPNSKEELEEWMAERLGL